jgi:hypothetical protein
MKSQLRSRRATMAPRLFRLEPNQQPTQVEWGSRKTRLIRAAMAAMSAAVDFRRVPPGSFQLKKRVA